MTVAVDFDANENFSIYLENIIHDATEIHYSFVPH